jgi:hypothetical protein
VLDFFFETLSAGIFQMTTKTFADSNLGSHAVKLTIHVT